MDFKTGKLAGNVVHLCVSLLALSVTAFAKKSSNITTPSGQSFCFFPKFLQTDCSSSSRVCEWTLGERLSLPVGEFSSPPSEFRAVRGTSQWTWAVLNLTSIVVSHIQASFFKPLTKTIHREYQCIENYGQDNNTFVVANKELSEHKRHINITFSCIRFTARSDTVVQYELGPWTNNLQNISCRDLAFQEYPLISDRYIGLLDCPLDLRGGFEILSIYDAQRQRRCHYPQGTLGILESDCLSKEGIYIDFGNTHNCTKPGIGNSHPAELNLRCHSKPWRQGNYTYVVTSRRARWPHEYEKTTFQCLVYESDTYTKGEFDLFIFNQPKCQRLRNVRRQFDKSDVFVLRVRRKVSHAQRSLSSANMCKFPGVFQGSWLEESAHNGIKKIEIKDGSITFNSRDSYVCKQRFVFKHKYSGCGFDRVDDRWPIHGRVGFFYDDYTLVSHFTNGCRARITRLGLSSTVQNRVLVYRLSQSEPIVDDGRSSEEYYQHEILKRLCAMTYLYKQDPFPFWGRNIEKIIHRERLPVQPIDKCSLVFNSRHSLMSTVAISDSTSCKGKSSKIYFGCKEPAGITKTLKIVYSHYCPKKDLTFACVGKAWKFGHFILLRDTVTQQLNCVWFDKESNAILRLDSSQCSDVDWGQLPGRADKFAERFKIKYFERCPHVPDPTIRAVVKNTGTPSVCHAAWVAILTASLGLLVLIS